MKRKLKSNEYRRLFQRKRARALTKFMTFQGEKTTQKEFALILKK